VTYPTTRTARGVDRFLAAQRPHYARILRELRVGRKDTHWMWYVFPQFRALAKSETARYFGIADKEEALAYLDNATLRARLAECTMTVLRHPRLTMFSDVDRGKLQACMTLFSQVVSDPTLPNSVLEKFYDGPHQLTLDVLAGKAITLPPSRGPVWNLGEGGMGHHWDKQVRRAQENVAQIGQRRPVTEPWSRERMNSFVRGFGLSNVATRQLVDAWLADQARARREGWEEGFDEGVEDAWNAAQ
jgi:uncharacterized protein (DUF1810 family)